MAIEGNIVLAKQLLSEHRADIKNNTAVRALIPLATSRGHRVITALLAAALGEQSMLEEIANSILHDGRLEVNTAWKVNQ